MGRVILIVIMTSVILNGLLLQAMAADTTPPVITNVGSTTVTFPAPVVLNLKTNENATCKYFMQPFPPGGPYTPRPFNDPSRITFQSDTTPTMTHTQYVSTFSPGYQYAFIECKDTAGNVAPLVVPNGSYDFIVSIFIQPPPPLPIPSIPQNVTATASQTTVGAPQVTLNWKASTTAGSSSSSILYNIYRRQLPATTFTQVYGIVNTPTWKDTNVGWGGTYEYKLTAMNIGGPIPSSASNSSSVVTVSTPLPLTGAFIINKGETATNSRDVSLDFYASSRVTAVKINNDVNPANWSTIPDVPFTPSMYLSWTLSAGGGQKTIYVRFKDAVGWMSSVYSDRISLNAPSSDTVARYEFSADASDLTGKGHDGQDNGNLAYDFMPNGNYFAKFNGVDSYIEVPSGAELNLGTQTVSFWVKPDYDNYAGKQYALISKGAENNKELYLEISGQFNGFGIVPDFGDVPAVSAPTNLGIEYGGVAVNGKKIIYISWQGNDDSIQGYHLEIRNPGGPCDSSCANELSAGTTSFNTYVDVAITAKDISVYAFTSKGTVSRAVSARVMFGAQGITVKTQTGAPLGWIPMDDGWHQVVRTWDAGGTVKYYIDGQRIFTGTGTAGPQGNSPLLIGAANLPTLISNQIVLEVDGSATVSWSSVAGKNYQVQSSTDGVTWDNVGDVVKALDGNGQVNDPYYQDGNTYKVLQLDDKVFKGGLDDLSIFNRALSDAEVTQLYQKEKSRDFRQIDRTYVDFTQFGGLPEPQYSAAMADLENLSAAYQSAFSNALPVNNDIDEMSLLLEQKWGKQKQFYIDQLRLLDKYGLLAAYNTTANQVIALYQPIWLAQEQAQGFQSAAPVASFAPQKGAVAKTTAAPLTVGRSSGVKSELVAEVKRQFNIPETPGMAITTKVPVAGISGSSGPRPLDAKDAGPEERCDYVQILFPCGGGPAFLIGTEGPRVPVPPYLSDSGLSGSRTSMVFDIYYLPAADGHCTLKVSKLTLDASATNALPVREGPVGFVYDGGLNNLEINKSGTWFGSASVNWQEIPTMYSGMSLSHTGKRKLNVLGQGAPLSLDLYSGVMEYAITGCMENSYVKDLKDYGDASHLTQIFLLLKRPTLFQCLAATDWHNSTSVKAAAEMLVDAAPGWQESGIRAFLGGYRAVCTDHDIIPGSIRGRFEVWGDTVFTLGQKNNKTFVIGNPLFHANKVTAEFTWNF